MHWRSNVTATFQQSSVRCSFETFILRKSHKSPRFLVRHRGSNKGKLTVLSVHLSLDAKSPNQWNMAHSYMLNWGLTVFMTMSYNRNPCHTSPGSNVNIKITFCLTRLQMSRDWRNQDAKAGVIQECRKRNKPRIQPDPDHLEVNVHAKTEHLWPKISSDPICTYCCHHMPSQRVSPCGVRQELENRMILEVEKQHV